MRSLLCLLKRPKRCIHVQGAMRPQTLSLTTAWRRMALQWRRHATSRVIALPYYPGFEKKAGFGGPLSLFTNQTTVPATKRSSLFSCDSEPSSLSEGLVSSGVMYSTLVGRTVPNRCQHRCFQCPSHKSSMTTLQTSSVITSQLRPGISASVQCSVSKTLTNSTKEQRGESCSLSYGGRATFRK